MKKIILEFLPALFGFAVLIFLIYALVVLLPKKLKNSQSNYTRYNDRNFPGLVSFSNTPRDTGNPIADIQLQRMVAANPGLARTIES